MGFQRAERKQARLRLALCGPAGSGKTYSALLIASGLIQEGEKIALLDTEAGSGELYADLVSYDYDRLDPPFEPGRYIEQIAEAEKAGYSVLIIDSLSHAWSGTGGVLDLKDRIAKASRSGNDWAAWRDVTPQHNALVDAILRSDLHIIACLRTKTAWEVTEDERGRKKPIKIGLKPEQREGVEYEFSVVMDMSVDGHMACASKDRTRLFDGRPMIPSVETGRQLRRWLDSGIGLSALEEESELAMIGYLEQIQGVVRSADLELWGRQTAEKMRALLPRHLEQARAAFRGRMVELRRVEGQWAEQNKRMAAVA